MGSYGSFFTGLPVVVLAASAVVGLLMLLLYAKIISRSGYSGWWVLAAFVPILNIVMILMFAFKEWPVQRELRELRAWANYVQAQQQAGSQPYPPQTPGAGYPGQY